MVSAEHSMPTARKSKVHVARSINLRWLVPYLYVAPALIAIGLFVYVPLGRAVQLSFFQGNLLNPFREYVGLGNYEIVLTSPMFHQVLLQSGLYMLFALVGSVVVPVSLALLTLQLSDREVDFYQSALFLPTVIAFNVVVLIWAFFFLPTTNGLFNRITALFGQPPNAWLKDPIWALPSIALIANWKLMGFHFLLAIAGLKAIPKEYMEAAAVDGASGWTLIRYIVLPLFAPTGLFLTTITLINAMDVVFTPIRVLTEGGPNNATNNLMYAVFSEGFRFFRLGHASAMSVILIILFGGLIYLQYRLLDRRIQYDR
ncbi:MAG: sugar ABC transporter permease [Anaerolineae bacterium]